MVPCTSDLHSCKECAGSSQKKLGKGNMAEAWKQQEQRATVQKHTQSLRYMAEALQMGRETAHTVSMQSGTKKMCAVVVAGTRTECSSHTLIGRLLLGIQSSWRARRRRLMTRSTRWICPSAFSGALLFVCARVVALSAYVPHESYWVENSIEA